MDDEELAAWRAVRDAADENALALHTGSAGLETELRLRALLAAGTGRATGLVGLVEIHGQRARQMHDPEWRAAHEAARTTYAVRHVHTEAALRDVLFCAGHWADDGASAATTTLALAEDLGGPDGTDLTWLNRGFEQFCAAGAHEGVRLVGRRLLQVARLRQDRCRAWRSRGLLARDETTDGSWRVLRAMWQCAATDEHRREVHGHLEARARDALETDESHDLVTAALFQQLVVGEPFAPWLQARVDRALARKLDEALDTIRRQVRTA